MKIAYNPITAEALTTAPANNDITFDLRGLNIFVRGVKFKGTDTTYSVFKKHTSSSGGGYNGLVPVPSYTSTNVRFLREDGTWQVPSNQYTYSSLTNQDLDTLKTEGKWYYLGGNNTVTNGPSDISKGGELYVGRNASGYRYQKVILYDGLIWFRIWNSSSWSDWKRWYTDANTDSKVLQSNTTTANYRPIILGYNNNADHNDISTSVTLLVYTTTSIYAQPSTGSLWATKLYSGGKPVLTDHLSLSNYVTLNTTLTITGLKTFTSQINSSLNTTTYLEGNKGKAIINSTAGAGQYVMLFKGNSTNGYFTHGVYLGKYLLQYTAKSTVDAGTNAVTKSVTLLDESRNSLFPGNVTAPKFIGSLLGNADSATKLTTSAGSATRPIYFADGKPVAGTYTFGNASGNAAINNGTVNSNLNADLLDGLHSSSFLRLQTISGTTDVNTLKDTRLYYTTSDAASLKLVNPPFTNTFSMILVANLINGDTDWRRSIIAFNPYGDMKIFNDRGTSGGGGVWYTVLTSGNYGSIADSRYVTSLGTSGNYLTWTKNGTTNNITIPYATSASKWATARTITLGSYLSGSVSLDGSANVTLNANVIGLTTQGRKTAISGITVPSSGVRLYEVYNNGYPTTYGNLLSIRGGGSAELLLAWKSTQRIYVRSKSDVSAEEWTAWKTVAFTDDNVASATKVKVSQHTTNNTNYPIVWSNLSNTNTGNSDLFKSWNHLYYNPSTRILTSYGGLTTNGIIKANNAFINTGDATLKVYSGKTTDGQNDGNICFQTSIDATDGLSHAYPTQYPQRCNISLLPRGGLVYIGINPSTGNTGNKLYVNGNSYTTGYFSGNTLTARVATGTAPLTVTSTTKVNNLNVDMLDNYHETAFPRLVGIKQGTWNWNDLTRAGYYKIQSGTVTNHPSGVYQFGMAEVITTENHADGENRELQIYYPHSQTNNIAIWLRMHNSSAQGSGWGSWVGVPNTNGNIASATKLLNKRTLWGQSFDGTANVSGNMTGVGSISASGDIILSQNGSTGTRQLRIQCGDNDYGRIAAGATASNAGWMEIATADDGNEPIYVRQYTGVYGTLKRTLTLLDRSGNTSMPGSLTVAGTTTSGNFNTGGRYISNFASGTWINSVTNAVLTCNYSGYGGIINAPTKGGRITIATYPGNDNVVYLGYATSAQISAGTNAFNRQARWNADNGFLYATGHVKDGSSDSYVLLGGGGHATLSGLGGSHTHTIFRNNLMIKGTNGISDLASIHLALGDSDTGFKWISDGVCQMYANNVAIGQWNSGGMNWLKQPSVNGQKIWHAGNDGSGSGLDADLVDGLHASRFPIYYSLNMSSTSNYWYKLGTARVSESNNIMIHIYGGNGWNSNANQNAYATLMIKAGYNPNGGLTREFGATMVNHHHSNMTYKLISPSNDTVDIWVKMPWGYSSGWYSIHGEYSSYTHSGASQSAEPTGNAQTGVETLTNAYTSSNVASATKLQTARQINGTNFNGTTNITTAKWGTARSIKIGNTAKNVDGSANISWSLSEIGAAAASHNHDSVYIKKSGDTMSGALNFANAMWNKVGDDVAIGDFNGAGLLGLKALNSSIPGIRFFNNGGTAIGTLTSNAGTLQWNGNTIWHSGNDGNFFKNRDYINNTSLDTFSSRNSGTYTVGYSGYSGLLSVFKHGSGSVSAIELYAPHYDISLGLRYRLAIDNNRYTGWRDFVFSDELNSLINDRIKWAYYLVTIESSSVTYSKWAGNYGFITKIRRSDVGLAILTISYPSGANYKNTIVLATGHHAESNWGNVAYASILPDYSSGRMLKLLIADDSVRNNGTAMILFMYIS